MKTILKFAAVFSFSMLVGFLLRSYAVSSYEAKAGSFDIHSYKKIVGGQRMMISVGDEPLLDVLLEKNLSIIASIDGAIAEIKGKKAAVIDRIKILKDIAPQSLELSVEISRLSSLDGWNLYYGQVRKNNGVSQYAFHSDKNFTGIPNVFMTFGDVSDVQSKQTFILQDSQYVKVDKINTTRNLAYINRLNGKQKFQLVDDRWETVE
ncbi:hypothetical protein SMSP1_00938 [Sedimentisphaera salicampi]|nr:hypothetical protein SMSP1_00938 [Sedimentisphaera salicampi]